MTTFRQSPVTFILGILAGTIIILGHQLYRANYEVSIRRAEHHTCYETRKENHALEAVAISWINQQSGGEISTDQILTVCSDPNRPREETVISLLSDGDGIPVPGDNFTCYKLRVQKDFSGHYVLNPDDH